MDKLIHAQTIVRESELSELKEKTGEEETKEALRKAVLCYIEEHNKEASKEIDVIEQHKKHLKEGAKVWSEEINQKLVDKL